MLRNAYFAIHGRAFVLQDLDGFFRQYSWYKPNAAFQEEALTDSERAHVEEIAIVERARRVDRIPFERWSPARVTDTDFDKVLQNVQAVTAGRRNKQDVKRGVTATAVFGEQHVPARCPKFNLSDMVEDEKGQLPTKCTLGSGGPRLLVTLVEPDGRRRTTNLVGMELSDGGTYDGFSLTATLDFDPPVPDLGPDSLMLFGDFGPALGRSARPLRPESQRAVETVIARQQGGRASSKGDYVSTDYNLDGAPEVLVRFEWAHGLSSTLFVFPRPDVCEKALVLREEHWY
ncbi:MAG: YARHG domain-containing protein [Deltaproteobacteria bacterium]|nr:YARHG domain-containing protein [Deltaproteobacteria bacterium]